MPTELFMPDLDYSWHPMPPWVRRRSSIQSSRRKSITSRTWSQPEIETARFLPYSNGSGPDDSVGPKGSWEQQTVSFSKDDEKRLPLQPEPRIQPNPQTGPEPQALTEQQQQQQQPQLPIETRRQSGPFPGLQVEDSYASLKSDWDVRYMGNGIKPSEYARHIASHTGRGTVTHTVRFHGKRWRPLLKRHHKEIEAALKKDIVEATGLSESRIEDLRFGYWDVLVAKFLVHHDQDGEEVNRVHMILGAYDFPHMAHLYRGTLRRTVLPGDIV
ncbi:hypothetical protein DQ04_06731010 [Trypanosoma grayi]|uniref:hypothetical protein n=1 Tax=Trypanosoma grayi TaxID=71804 RepID=UPI0004F4432E|nr:hypothetical protein DQ04_06731010 [Trypanosoma grayi]KEG08644.1 hypothetical protein DQ04_06731010 [Trypanosoma grayi]